MASAKLVSSKLASETSKPKATAETVFSPGDSGDGGGEIGDGGGEGEGGGGDGLKHSVDVHTQSSP
jgi:hypothetical protein